jgi:hypothetical protein
LDFDLHENGQFPEGKQDCGGGGFEENALAGKKGIAKVMLDMVIAIAIVAITTTVRYAFIFTYDV